MTIEQSLDIFGTYEEGWDGDNANAITKEAIANMRDFLSKLPPKYYDKIGLYDLFPTPNGTMIIELNIDNHNRKYFVIDIGKTKILFYYRYLDKIVGHDIAIEYKGLETVKEIEKLLQDFYNKEKANHVSI